jgi:hypothetical protein
MVSFYLSFKKSMKSCALTALVVVSLCIAGAAQADPACDATFMKAMKDKAWMEAQREMMISQSIISKPDSVFALGCFNSFFSGSGTGGFSNGTKYDISSKVDSFVSAAFGTYGGGHLSGTNAPSAGCGTMMSLWNAARCTNLDEANIKTLTETSTYDRGAYPQACGSPGSWSTPLNTFSTKAAGKSVGASFDDMNLFLGVTAPVSQLSPSTCSKGIETGVTFDGNTKEVVCPNPGCSPNADTSPKCCKTTVSGGNISYSNCSS